MPKKFYEITPCLIKCFHYREIKGRQKYLWLVGLTEICKVNGWISMAGLVCLHLLACFKKCMLNKNLSLLFGITVVQAVAIPKHSNYFA